MGLNAVPPEAHSRQQGQPQRRRGAVGVQSAYGEQGAPLAQPSEGSRDAEQPKWNNKVPVGIEESGSAGPDCAETR